MRVNRAPPWAAADQAAAGMGARATSSRRAGRRMGRVGGRCRVQPASRSVLSSAIASTQPACPS